MNCRFLIVPLALLVTTACVVPAGTVQPPSVKTVPLAKRYTVTCETRSPAGFGAGFHDPRKGGECWACPNSNPIRTWAAVTQANACATRSVLGIGAKPARARYLGPHGRCPGGDVQQGGNCLYCPKGSSWNAARGGCIQS